MKIAKICVILVLALSLFAACNTRNNRGVDHSRVPSVTSPGNLVRDGANDRNGVYDGNRAGGNMLDNGGIVGGNRVGGVNTPSRGTPGANSSRPAPGRNIPAEDNLNDMPKSAAAAMSTDFIEIGALDSTKRGWGSGGPTDDHGRPEGATSFQKKFGHLGAYFITPAGSNIYLTFDSGYENGYTPMILDKLRDRGVKAVFFITMDYARRQPELVERMIKEGHILGNHSTLHKSFPDMSFEDAVSDIKELHNYVKANFGYEMHLFRPPMGEFSEQTLALTQNLGYKSVFWSVAYKDWLVDDQPSTIEAMDILTSRTHPGAIILLHAISRTNTEILGDFIDAARSQGYEFARWDW